jgi:hypothetical protein
MNTKPSDDDPTNTPREDDQAAMYVVLRWDRYPTWPTFALPTVVDDRAEAEEEARRQVGSAKARGLASRFTVHPVMWPPVSEWTT